MGSPDEKRCRQAGEYWGVDINGQGHCVYLQTLNVISTLKRSKGISVIETSFAFYGENKKSSRWISEKILRSSTPMNLRWGRNVWVTPYAFNFPASHFIPSIQFSSFNREPHWVMSSQKYSIPSARARKLDQKMRCDDGREKNVETRNSARAFGALFSAQTDLKWISFYQKKTLEPLAHTRDPVRAGLVSQRYFS